MWTALLDQDWKYSGSLPNAVEGSLTQAGEMARLEASVNLQRGITLRLILLKRGIAGHLHLV